MEPGRGAAAPALLPPLPGDSLPARTGRDTARLPFPITSAYPQNNYLRQQLAGSAERKAAELLTDEFIDTAASHCVKRAAGGMAEVGRGSLRWPGWI